MNTPITALLISTDTSRPVEVLSITDPTEGIKFLVGGWFETITPRGLDQDWWLNETGKLEGLAPNARATLLAHHHQAIAAHDYIAGDLVITGGPDDHGITLGLPTDQAADLIRLLPETSWPRP